VGDWQVLHIVASQFEGTFAPDALLGIVGEGGETVDLLEHAQVESGAVDGLEAAKGLVVLGEDADHLLSGVVGGGDVMTFDGVDQVGPVAFQEVKDEGSVGHVSDEGLTSSQHPVIASLSRALGRGIEDMINLLPERIDLWVAVSVIRAVRFLEALVDLLQGVEDTLVVDRLWEDGDHDISVVDTHIGDPVLGRTGQVR
jgi:hypothetical protein